VVAREHESMVSRWLPVTALVRRELVRTLRTKRFLALIALGFALSGILLGLNWPREVSRLSTVREVGIGIPMLVLVGIGCLGIAMLPGYAAAAIRGEKDRDTYEMMSMTMLTPAGILFGKLLNVIGVFAVIVVTALPLIGTDYFLMGLEWQLLLPFALLMVLALTCVSAGLFCSSIATTLPRALVGTYLLIAVLMGGYLIPLYVSLAVYTFAYEMSDNFSDSNFLDVLNFLTSITPFGALEDWILSLSFSQRPVPGIFLCGAQQLIFSAVLLLLTWLILRRNPDQGSRFVALIRRKPAKSRKPSQAPVGAIPDHRNPIFVREIRALTTAWQRARLRVVLVTLLALGVFLMTAYTIREVGKFPEVTKSDEIYEGVIFSWVMGLIGVAALVAPGVSTPLWARERDKDTREQLMMTLMRPRDIVFGKSGAALCFTMTAVLVAALSTSPLVVSLAYVENVLFKVVCGVATIAVTAFCVIAIGSQAAQLRVNTTASVVLSYVLAAAYILLPAFLVTHVIEVMRLFGAANDFQVRALLSASPLLTWLDAIFPYAYFPRTPYRSEVENVLFISFVLAVHAGLAILLLFDSIRVEGRFKNKDHSA